MRGNGRRGGHVIVLVLALVLVASGVEVGSSSLASAAEPCTQPLVVGARGSGESAGFGDTVVKSVDAFNAVYGSATDAVPLDYPAAGIGPVWVIKPWRAGEFKTSVTGGIAELELLLTTRAKSCPSQRIVLFGYSQGALVVNRALIALNQSNPKIVKRVAAVGLIADPARLGSSKSNTGTASSKLNGIAVATKTAAKRDLYGFLHSKVRGVCLDGDLVCAYKTGTDALDPGAMHAVYKSSLAAELGTWAAKRLNGGSIGSSSTTGSSAKQGTTLPTHAKAVTFTAADGWRFKFNPSPGIVTVRLTKDIHTSPPGKAKLNVTISTTAGDLFPGTVVGATEGRTPPAAEVSQSVYATWPLPDAVTSALFPDGSQYATGDLSWPEGCLPWKTASVTTPTIFSCGMDSHAYSRRYTSKELAESDVDTLIHAMAHAGQPTLSFDLFEKDGLSGTMVASVTLLPDGTSHISIDGS